MNFIQIPEGKFFQFKATFYAQCKRLPLVCSLIVSVPAVATLDNTFETFVGNRPRTSTPYKVYCLYKRDLSVYDRTKYGIDKDVEMLVWIPPQEIEKYFGAYNFRINSETTKVQFEDYAQDTAGGTVMVIDKVVYQAPLYDSCMAVELHLKRLKH